MSEKWRQSEIRIVINDTLGSMFLHYTFIILFAGKRILKINEHLAKLRGKIVSFSIGSWHQQVSVTYDS